MSNDNTSGDVGSRGAQQGQHPDGSQGTAGQQRPSQKLPLADQEGSGHEARIVDEHDGSDPAADTGVSDD